MFSLCTPSIVYLVYAVSQVIAKMMRGLYSEALIEMVISCLFAVFLNYLCSIDMKVFAWAIIFVPFVLMSVVIALLLYLFTRDPETGRILFNDKEYDPVSAEMTEFDPRAVVNQLVDNTTNLFAMNDTMPHNTGVAPKELTKSGSKSVAETATDVTQEETTEETQEGTTEETQETMEMMKMMREIKPYYAKWGNIDGKFMDLN